MQSFLIIDPPTKFALDDFPSLHNLYLTIIPQKKKTFLRLLDDQSKTIAALFGQSTLSEYYLRFFLWDGQI